MPGIEEAFAANDIPSDENTSTEARFGITGAEAALAAPGSIVLASGKGNNRTASLFPLINIAVVRVNQVVKDLDSWVSIVQANANEFQKESNIVIISGPSKTADIAIQLGLGMHGS